MKVLTLDLGATTGFCVGDEKHHVNGFWGFKPSRFEGGGIRFVRFRNKLAELYAAYRFERVAFEEVHRHAATAAAHAYGGYLATLTAWCEEIGIPYEGVGVGTIKRFWTGKGNASKELMLAACHAKEMSVTDDNEADAIALFHLMLEKVKHDARSIGCVAEQHDSAVREGGSDTDVLRRSGLL